MNKKQGDQIQFSLEKSLEKKMVSSIHNPIIPVDGLCYKME